MPSKSTQILEDQELGKIKVTKYKGAKSIKIRVKENLNISVTLPYRASFKKAEIFISEKKSWILEQISKFKKQKNQTFFFGASGQKGEYVIRKRDIVYFTFAIASAQV